jgi:hypothetical protein
VKILIALALFAAGYAAASLPTSQLDEAHAYCQEVNKAWMREKGFVK